MTIPSTHPGDRLASRRQWPGLGLDLSIALLLALFVLALYYRLLFTNRVLASGDILLYFYPYRDYAAAALRQGQIPLWNPYIFLGVPFLANPQAAVLYPLHWPLSWLAVTKQLYWSAALHTWILGLGGYFLLRRWHLNSWAAAVGGLVLAGSGFYGGMIGHINQMNGAAWLPWAVLVLENGIRNTEYGIRNYVVGIAAYVVLFAGLVALMLLAGHTQTAYINLFGIGVWVIWPLVAGLRTSTLRTSRLGLLPRLLIYGMGTVLGVLLSAAQLLPTLELSNLGLRGGGLTYSEVSSFSLPLLRLPFTLLPTYGLLDLGVVFGTAGYSEFVAYIGVIGLALAAVGAWQGRGTARTFGLLFAFLGLFLALGRFNPVYFLLYKIVPGFDLFRTPARWMMLYTLGMAVLAGVGIDVLLNRRGLELGTWRLGKRWRIQMPISNLQSPIPNLIFLSLLALDLLLAARSLPHTQPTAPQAVYDLRTAPAHLLTDPARTTLDPAAAGRFLSLSTTGFDPGDLADLRRILREGTPPQLDQRAFDELLVALKAQEILAPNLSLLWRIPAVDGFDGGVLPLQRYLDFLTLFILPDQLVPDGRLREQIDTVPAADLLGLLNVQYVITDKVRDLWFEDVYYDRQIGARMAANELNQVAIDVPQPFAATHIGLIGYIDGDPQALATLQAQNVSVATVNVQTVNGTSLPFTLSAGGQPGAALADGALDSALARGSGATIAYRDVENKRQEYGVQLALPQPTQPLSITVQRLATPFDLVIQAVTLVDTRTGMFVPLLPSDRGRFQMVHSGDVKIYENLAGRPRAYLANDVVAADNSQAALAFLQEGKAGLDGRAVVEGLPSFTTQPAAGDHAEIVAYTPERVEIQTRNTNRALLVLSDSAYPGWTATVDGQPSPIYTTNYLFRGIDLPPGEHTVLFQYQPMSWRRGLWLSATGGLFCLLLLSVNILQRIRQNAND